MFTSDIEQIPDVSNAATDSPLESKSRLTIDLPWFKRIKDEWMFVNVNKSLIYLPLPLSFDFFVI